MGAQNILEPDNEYQPDFKWFWNNSFFWAYSTPAGVQIYGQNITEFQQIIENAITELSKDLEEEEIEGKKSED